MRGVKLAGRDKVEIYKKRAAADQCAQSGENSLEVCSNRDNRERDEKHFARWRSSKGQLEVMRLHVVRTLA